MTLKEARYRADWGAARIANRHPDWERMVAGAIMDNNNDKFAKSRSANNDQPVKVKKQTSPAKAVPVQARSGCQEVSENIQSLFPQE